MKYKILAIITILVLSGCASVSLKDPLGHSPLYPVIMTSCVKVSAQPNVFNKALSAKDDNPVFKKETEAALIDVQKAMDADMIKSDLIHVQYQPECTEGPEESAGQETFNPDLDLIFDISGYGSIKPKWKKYLIGTGIVEGVVQGIVVGSATQNVWLGLGVALEEFGSEYLTWNGVDWILGETFAPVTLEGALVRHSDQVMIWRESIFITKNKDELKKLDDQEKKKKEKQLQASLHKAESRLLSSLNHYLEDEILDNKYNHAVKPDH
ncbi:MAG: hypothetical protein AABY87_07650 [bacterium]